MSHSASRSRALTPAAAGFLAGRLGEGLQRLEEALDRLHGDPGDEEAVHDVRVSSRRLRGALAASKAYLARKRGKRAARGLRALRTALGTTREIEVVLSTLAGLRGEMGGRERRAAGVLSGVMTARRDRLRSDAASLLAGVPVDRLRRDLRRLVRDLEDRAGQEGKLADLAHDAAAAIAARRGAVLGLPRGPLEAADDGALHRFRIETKKLRYTMEFFEPLFPPHVLEGRLKLLKRIQDDLGAMHDLADAHRMVEEAAAGTAASAFEAGGAPLGDLAARIEARRRRLGAAFPRLYAAVAHPGFLPAALGTGEARLSAGGKLPTGGAGASRSTAGSPPAPAPGDAGGSGAPLPAEPPGTPEPASPHPEVAEKPHPRLRILGSPGDEPGGDAEP